MRKGHTVVCLKAEETSPKACWYSLRGLEVFLRIPEFQKGLRKKQKGLRKEQKGLRKERKGLRRERRDQKRNRDHKERTGKNRG
jgi:hypothetical protein